MTEIQTRPSLVVGTSIVAAHVAGDTEMLAFYEAAFTAEERLAAVLKAAALLTRARARTTGLSPQEAADRCVAAAIAAANHCHPVGSQF